MNETIKRIYELQVKVAQESLNSLKQLQTHAAGTERSLGGLLNSLKGFAAGAVGAFSIKAVVDQILDTVKAIDELDKQAGRLKMPVAEFAALKYAANQADVELGELTTGLKFLQKAIAEAQIKPGGQQGRLLEALGVDARSGASLTEQLLKISGAFQNITDAALKTKAELVLFGRSGTAFAEMLAQGPEAVQKFIDAQKQMNAVTDDVLKRQRELEEQQKQLNEQFTNVKITLVDGLLPALTSVARFFNQTITKADLKEWGEALGNMFESSVRKGAAIREELAGLADMFAGIRDLAKTDTLRNAGPALDRIAEGWNRARKAAQTAETQFALSTMELEMTTPTLAANNKALNANVEATNKSEEANKKLRAALAEANKEKKTRNELDDAHVQAFAKVNAARQSEIDRLTAGTAIKQTEEYLRKVALLDDAFFRGEMSAELYDQAIKLLSGSMEKAGKEAETLTIIVDKSAKDLSEMEALLKDIADKVDGYGQRISGIFVDWATGADNAKLSFGQMAADMARQIAQMTLQMLVFDKIVKQIAQAIAGLNFGSLDMGQMIGQGMMSAKGNVFDRGNVIPFARGGVVTRPTIFPMAQGWGLMGEAGPEAVMPLGRTSSGQLGVKGGGVTVNIINNTPAKVTAKEERTSTGGHTITVMVENAVENGFASGRFDKVMAGTYGMARTGRT